MLPFFRSRRPAPLPAQWQELLADNIHWQSLPGPDRVRLQERLQEFLAQKRFEGANGMVVDDAVRLTVACQACLLILNRPGPCFPALSSIVVYPEEYLAFWQECDESGIVIEGEECRSGEWADNGALVLSWEDVKLSGVDESGAYNVIIHECAHLLDDEYGLSREKESPLGRQLEREYLRLQHDLAHRRPVLFDRYGAESRSEFFAVASETFFENPLPLKQRHPDLYAALVSFFNADPAAWRGQDPA